MKKLPRAPILESDPDLLCSNPECRSRGLVFFRSRGETIPGIHEDCGGTFKLLQNIGRFSDYVCDCCSARRSFTSRTYQCLKCGSMLDVDLCETMLKSGEVTVKKRVTGEFRMDRLPRRLALDD